MFKPKPTYFTTQDLKLILEFDNQLQKTIEELKLERDLQRALELSRQYEREPFSVFLADFKASREK